MAAEALPRRAHRRCIVALGGNVGDVAATFVAALNAMGARGLEVQCVSRLYRTRAQVAPGAKGQDDYLNAACVVESRHDPAATLAQLHVLERAAGLRAPQRWAPRRLDLDLVAYENFYHTQTGLVVPHPRAKARLFVLLPACDVAPDWPLEADGSTFAQVRARFAPGRDDVVDSWLSWPAARYVGKT